MVITRNTVIMARAKSEESHTTQVNLPRRTHVRSKWAGKPGDLTKGG